MLHEETVTTMFNKMLKKNIEQTLRPKYYLKTENIFCVCKNYYNLHYLNIMD